MSFVFNDYENTFGNPQIYKNMSIYPVKIKDMPQFYWGLQCLTEMKNWTDDIVQLKMTYLRYLHDKILKETPLELEKKTYDITKYKFETILILCFGEDIKYSFDFDRSNNTILRINDNVINSTDFDKIRDIIFKQNKINHDDLMSKDFYESFEKFKSYKNETPPTLSEMIVSYRVAMKLQYKEIYELTIFQFYEDLNRFSMLKDYEVFTYPILKSGKQTEDWRRHIEHNPYKGMFCGREEITNTIK